MLQSQKSNRGMVVAPHHLAAQAGLGVLREGGNAIEATVAAAAAIAVVYPHMNALGGDNFVEMDRNHQDSFCCGAGGGRMWMEEHIGTSINGDRAKEAIDTGAKTVATACPFCMTMLTDGLRDQGHDEVVQKDVAELLLEAVKGATDTASA